jgi:hypothetical protein
MKIDGLDFIDWLHKIRAESEAERKRRGLSGADWVRLRRRASRRALHRMKTSRRVTASRQVVRTP